MGAASNVSGRRDALSDEERVRITEELGRVKEGGLLLGTKNVARLVDMVDCALQTAWLNTVPTGFDYRNESENVEKYLGFKNFIFKSVHDFINSASALQENIAGYTLSSARRNGQSGAVGEGEVDEALNEAASSSIDESAAEIIRQTLKLLTNLSPRDAIRQPRSRPPAMDELRYLTRAVCHWRKTEKLATQFYWPDINQSHGGNRTTDLIQKVAEQFSIHLDRARVATHLRKYGNEIRARPDGGTSQDDFSQFWSP